MPLSGIEYSDVDDRWWVDLICQEEALRVRYASDRPTLLTPVATINARSEA
jgi:hypothetical protein